MPDTMNAQISKTSIVLTVVFVILVSSFIISYVFLESNSDSHSSVEGYKVFTGRDDGFRIEFEYPDTWQKRPIEKYGTFIVLSFRPSDTSTVSLWSDEKSNNGGNYTGVDELVNHIIAIHSDSPDFEIVSQTITQIGGIEARELIISYRQYAEDDPHFPPGYIIDIPSIDRIEIVEYQDRIYKLSLMVRSEQYETLKEDFEHMISSFRFLD